MRSFFDTNVLVYLFDAGAPVKQSCAQALLQEEVAVGQAVLSTQIVQEFYVAVTRKLAKPLRPATASLAVDKLCELPLVSVNTELIKAAIRRQEQDGFSFWDALVIETALSCGATTLWTEDLQHHRQIGAMVIKNPFA